MYNPMDITRIDRQIDELQRLKANYQGMQQPQQPINNIITSQPVQPIQQIAPLFEAKFTTENPADILIQHKTAFIDIKNGKLSIKELDGEIKEYGLILPKDEKDIRIEELETKMKKLESSYNALLMQSSTVNNKSINTIPIIQPNKTIVPETTISNVTDETIMNIEETVLDNTNITNNVLDNTMAKGFKKGMFKGK